MRRRGGKWVFHRILLKSLRSHLPNTMMFSKKNFSHFLDKYDDFIIKPCFGSKGRHVMKITKINERTLEVHNGYSKKMMTIDYNYYQVKNQILNKKGAYIIQEAIPLAKIGGQPFDIRVMIQRKKNFSSWEITGSLVKVALEGFIITNASKEVLTLEDGLNKAVFSRAVCIETLIREINIVSLHSAFLISDKFMSRKIGVDVGVDEYGKVWIIEINLNPSIMMFEKLGDEELVNNMRQYDSM